MEKKLVNLIPVLLLGAIMLSSCEAIGSIFKAGVWTGTIGVILLVVIIIVVVMRLFGGRGKNT